MRPRLLYVPIFAAFEAGPLRAAVGDWADVESFDGPGAGTRRAEEPGGYEDMAAAGAARLDELGWDRCVLVCDSHAQPSGIELAVRDPRVAAIAVSHPAPRYTTEGERPALNAALYDAAGRLLTTNRRSFGHALTQLTQGTIDEAWVADFIEQVPRATARRRTAGLSETVDLVPRLREEDLEVLLAGHRGCLMWTPEGFEDAAAAVPRARVIECDDVPLGSPGYHAALRELCEAVFG